MHQHCLRTPHLPPLVADTCRLAHSLFPKKVVQDTCGTHSARNILRLHLESASEAVKTLCRDAKSTFHHHAGARVAPVERVALGVTDPAAGIWTEEVCLQWEGLVTHYNMWQSDTAGRSGGTTVWWEAEAAVLQALSQAKSPRKHACIAISSRASNQFFFSAFLLSPKFKAYLGITARRSSAEMRPRPENIMYN